MNGSTDKAMDGPSWFVELPTPWPTKVLTLLCRVRVCVCLCVSVVVVVVAGLFTMSLEMFPQMFSSSLMVCLITRAMRSCCGFVAIVSLTWTAKIRIKQTVHSTVCVSICVLVRVFSAFSAKFSFQQRRWRRRVSTSSRSICN